MRELNFIEDNGRFGITFTSDNKAEANTVMNAVQRFILKNSEKETKEYIQKEINNERENKSFEEQIKSNNEIIDFGEDEEETDYKIDAKEDPLSSGADNINNWDKDGGKIDTAGNKFLFDD